MPSLVTISGTSRPDNYTSRALAVVDDELRNSGCEVNSFDARTLALGFPGQPVTEDAKRLTEAVSSAAGLVLATPEYHGSFAAMTKLIIENLGFPSALAGKPIALVGVAAGRIGAIKTLEQLRGVCAHIGAMVLPHSISIAGVRQSFDDESGCTDASAEAALRGLARSLVDYLRDYVCPKHTLEAQARGQSTPWVASV